MADIAVHLAQGEHNREVARHLIPPRHDWAITAAFYSAVHYFEAWLYDRPEQHSETSIPTDASGNLTVSAHAWREQLIFKFLSREGFKSFRKLRDASETARYLSLFRIGSTTSPSWISAPASAHFSDHDAEELVVKHLEKLRAELLVEWKQFVELLRLRNRDPVVGTLLRVKLLQAFRDKDDLLRNSEKTLRKSLGSAELTLLKKALEELGFSLAPS